MKIKIISSKSEAEAILTEYFNSIFSKLTELTSRKMELGVEIE